MAKEQADTVIIGSGVGGLSGGALLARYGFEVIVCESHSIPGGAAHAFEREAFHFDSGPSVYSGLSSSPSTNPLRQVLDAISEPLPCVTYDTWGFYLPEGEFAAPVGADACSSYTPARLNTRLSQPFQKNVPAGKLFSVERTVSQLLEVMENLDEGDSGQFFSWDGSRLPRQSNTHIFSTVKIFAIKSYRCLIFRYTVEVVILLLQTMLIPIPATLKANARLQGLKKRLDWGKPALTIIR